MSATPQQVRQWSDEVAADPASPAFLPLARAYRDAGRRDAALRLVVRGLERHPNDVEAHCLLGQLYREGGDLVKAFDEFDIALALAPEHHAARREIGIVCFERGDWAGAVRHLERARETDVEDDEVRQVLEDAWVRHRGGASPRRAPAPADASTASSGIAQAPSPPATASADGRAPGAGSAAAPASPASAEAVAVTASVDGGWGGGREFDALQAEFHALSGERGMVGAVMLDAQGYVVAGEMHVAGRDRGPEVATVLSPATAEAERAIRHLGLGALRGIIVETPDAIVRLAPTGDGGLVAVAGRRDVPMGWVLRVAARARDAAVRFVSALNGGAP